MTDGGPELRQQSSNERIGRMEGALAIIAKASCEKLTTDPRSCWSQPTWSPDAQSARMGSATPASPWPGCSRSELLSRLANPGKPASQVSHLGERPIPRL